MNPEQNRNRKMGKVLLRVIVSSIILMMLATGFYYWKGLARLEKADPLLGSYYEPM